MAGGHLISSSVTDGESDPGRDSSLAWTRRCPPELAEERERDTEVLGPGAAARSRRGTVWCGWENVQEARGIKGAWVRCDFLFNQWV